MPESLQATATTPPITLPLPAITHMVQLVDKAFVSPRLGCSVPPTRGSLGKTECNARYRAGETP
ncbi:MAG: hypothetical protein C0511_03660 [Hyphomicrobium sp.]|nr:hypothetical protein [Hyphomicrobium sp.]